MNNPFDKYTLEYDKWYDKNKYIFLSELKCIKKTIGSLKNKKSIEIGVGTARFAEKLNIKYGVDISKNALKIAQKRKVKTYLSKAEKLPFKDEEFDCAFMIFSICFFKNPYLAIKEASRILKKNGTLVITFINGKSKLARYYRKIRHKTIFYRSAKFYSPQTLIKIMQKNGFSNFKIFQTLLTPPKELKNLKKVEKTIRGCHKGGVVVIKGVKKWD